MSSVMDLSNALAGAVDSAARSVFAVHGRPRLPSTGVHWRPGLVVTASHTVESDREVTLTTPDDRSLSAQVAPPTLNLEEPSEGCDLDLVPREAKRRPIQYALSNSFAFGGANATLVFGKVD